MLVVAPPAAQELDAPENHAQELEALTTEIGTLAAELVQLRGRERSVLGELEQFDAELLLRETEVRQASLQLEDVNGAIEGHDSNLTRLDRAQAERRRYLAFRLREIYKAGWDQMLQRVLIGGRDESYWEGLRYASLLSERDAQVLDGFYVDEQRTSVERLALAERREELATLHRELARRREGVAAARRDRASVLEGIRRDEGQRRTALVELRAAAEELGRMAEALRASGESDALAIEPFKGLLEWPTAGELSAGFGSVVHPEFKTKIPHPGWDIAARFGANVQTVFDGEVVFADWMRGYGLTAIVDHGTGVLTIYAHASMLLVQTGERVVRGQILGKVGETGSLRGPYLYFELRVDGEAIDPASWLRAAPSP